MKSFNRPSPALVLASLALVFAMVGTAVAGPDALSRAITKSKVKKVADKRIDKAEPKLRVAHADTAGVAGDVRYATSGNNVLPWTTNVNQTVASVSLPAGVWAVTAKVVPNNNGAATVQYDCQLVVGGQEVDRLGSGPYPNLQLDLGASASDADRAVVTLNGAATLAVAGTADLICQSNGASGNWLARTITAVQVATLNGA